jgi:tRNA G18 (ribose-2'-O)-methylase SpoU
MKEMVLILPNIRSCYNVGAMFRTADACGFAKIYLVGFTPDPEHHRLKKVALGAETWVPWEKVDDLHQLLITLKKDGFQLIALEQSPRSQEFGNFAVADKVALVVGNELDGTDVFTLEIADVVAEIPMRGKKQSLNVAIATGIAMFEISK